MTIFNNILFRMWLWDEQINISVILLKQKKGFELLEIWMDFTRKLNMSLYNDANVK